MAKIYTDTELQSMSLEELKKIDKQLSGNVGKSANTSKLQQGGLLKRPETGIGSCPPGQHWMPSVNGKPGYCMKGKTHKFGRKIRRRR